MRLKLLAPGVSEDGKLVFPFVDQDDPEQAIITVVKEVSSDYTEAEILTAKTDAISEATTTATTNEENRTARERALAAITLLGLGEEEIT